MTIEEQIFWMQELSLINDQFDIIVASLKMLNFYMQAYPVVIKECGEYQRALELACQTLSKHCAESRECVINCPLYGTEHCRNGVAKPIDWRLNFIKKAEQSEDDGNV